MMTWTVNTCLLTLAILCVWRGDEVAEACSCPTMNFQERFCNSDMVIKAKVLSMHKIGITHAGPITTYGYNIKPLKVYKGGCITIKDVYTASSSAACGVSLKYNTVYLLSGTFRNGRMHINLCNWNVPWDSLTPSQKWGVASQYEMGCACKITYCYSLPCAISKPAECLWGYGEIDKKLYGESTTNYVCVKKSDGSCAWCNKKNCLDSNNS